jgi:hypothetical protein
MGYVKAPHQRGAGALAARPVLHPYLTKRLRFLKRKWRQGRATDRDRQELAKLMLWFS